MTGERDHHRHTQPPTVLVRCWEALSQKQHKLQRGFEPFVDISTSGRRERGQSRTSARLYTFLVSVISPRTSATADNGASAGVGPSRLAAALISSADSSIKKRRTLDAPGSLSGTSTEILNRISIGGHTWNYSLRLSSALAFSATWRFVTTRKNNELRGPTTTSPARVSSPDRRAAKKDGHLFQLLGRVTHWPSRSRCHDLMGTCLTVARGRKDGHQKHAATRPTKRARADKGCNFSKGQQRRCPGSIPSAPRASLSCGACVGYTAHSSCSTHRSVRAAASCRTHKPAARFNSPPRRLPPFGRGQLRRSHFGGLL